MSTEESSWLRASMLHLDHCTQGGSELWLNGVDNLYIPTSSLTICFSVLEDRGWSVELVLTRSDTFALSLLLSVVDAAKSIPQAVQ